MLTVVAAIILTIIVIGIIMYLYYSLEGALFAGPIIPEMNNSNPKEELVNFFALNWGRLAPIFIRKDCNDEYVPQDIMYEFKNKFGHYFENKAQKNDPMLNHFMQGTFERNFKMEVKEICTTLTKLGDFINSTKYPSIDLKTLGKEIERLHTEHFPQAVFISVILDRMLQICNKYPEYNVNQIANTHDLLTMSVIFHLSMPTKYW